MLSTPTVRATETTIPEPYTVTVGSEETAGGSEAVEYNKANAKTESEEEAKNTVYVVIDTLIFILGSLILSYCTLFTVCYLVDKTLSITGNMLIRFVTFGKLDSDMLSIPRFIIILSIASGIGVGFVTGLIRNIVLALMESALKYM